jgi:hypothetical protein
VLLSPQAEQTQNASFPGSENYFSANNKTSPVFYCRPFEGEHNGDKK